MIKEFEKLNLQLFAEDTENGGGKEEEGVDKTDTTDKEKEVEKTLEEVLADKEKEWQSETDRRVNKALERYKKEQEEKERLAKLSEDEKIKEIERQKDEALKLREMELDIKDAKLSIIEETKTAGIIELSEVLKPENYLGENKSQLATDIDSIKKFIDAEVAKKEAIFRDEYLTGETPNNPPNKRTGITKEAFNKMGIIERTKLFNENPELYKSLSK